VQIAAIAFLTFAAIALWAIDPATSAVFPVCPFRLLTGWQCPGCGSARALHQLLHGRIDEAWRLNAAAVLALPAIGVDLVQRKVSGSTGWLAILSPTSVWLIAAALVGFGVARNFYA